MIKQENLFKKLGLILEELNDQYQFLAKNPQQLNELELELFHANANFLADHVQIIKKINQNAKLSPTPITESPMSEIQKAEALDDAKPETLTETEVWLGELVKKEEESPTASVVEFDNIKNQVLKVESQAELPAFEFLLNEEQHQSDKFDFEEKHVDELFNRPLSQEEQHILAEKRKLMEDSADEELEITTSETPDEEEIGPEPFLVYKADETQPDLATKDTTPPQIENSRAAKLPAQPTLNDLLAPKLTDSSINATIHTGISDLTQGINLNDKLLYIKDLFNGYNLAYAEAIALANKLPNFEAADAFFQKNYALKNNWAAKQATVDKFYELLNQRFK